MSVLENQRLMVVCQNLRIQNGKYKKNKKGDMMLDERRVALVSFVDLDSLQVISHKVVYNSDKHHLDQKYVYYL